MAHIALGAPERAALLVLMRLGGTASNAELRDAAGLTLDGAPRRKAEDLGLIECTKVGRSFRHELTEKGWGWCVGELRAAPPPRAGSLGRALYAILPMIADHLDRADLGLADFVVPPAAPEPADLETQIRDAYAKAADAPGAWVLLTAVRPLLGDAHRDDVDAELRRMERLPDVFIAPEADQKTLTAADRDAAVRLGGTSKHLLAIEAR
ncbi:hypothetical protein [Actinomadura flavalba]|uniref:hypothetical protein n=1 Tax=Actinomadura flavalba TaxID=1120938 RepID=UPI00039CD470|nr:hypothetical protein [Actinomadura flavalba]